MKNGIMNTNLSTMKNEDFVRKNWETMSRADIAKTLQISERQVYNIGKKLDLIRKANNGIVRNTEETLDTYREKKEARSTTQQQKKIIDQVIEENDKLKRERDAALKLQEVQTHRIEHKISSGESEAVAVVLASDWHIEETVKPEKVNFKNAYNLDIAKKRADEFFVNTLKLIKKEQQATKIDTLVLALLGDFISGNIHEELLENCSLPPIDAMLLAQEMLTSGIEYLLQNSTLNLIIPCHVGNHTRITRKIHIANEQGNALESFSYHTMRNYFEKSKYKNRVKFLIADGYYQILEVYNYKIRFHHGHAIKYGGGIGGLFIPAYKAISQWQKVDYADLDCFGHLHQTKDGGNFLCNGSLIGYNTFSVMIKGDFEKPKQTFFLIDKKRGRTGVFPITFSV